LSRPVITTTPPNATWFKMSEINEIERQSLPEFFTGKFSSKTPQIYKEYRDFMINAYQQNSGQYLTQTACRRNLAGDVCSILRVHTFLEHWGLINYGINPDVVVPVPKNPLATDSTSTPAQHMLHLRSESRSPKTVQGPSDLPLRKNIFPTPPKFTCATCSTNCSKSRYFSSKGNIDICPNCFTQGKFSENLSSSNFIKVDTPIESDPGEWTDQETLLLLEAIERFGESWDTVAEHVATKTREQCLLHFTRLPIEDPYLEDNLTKAHTKSKESIPFSETDNPIMSMITFLSSVVSPNIASVAAQSALSVFIKQRKEGLKENSKNEGLLHPSNQDNYFDSPKEDSNLKESITEKNENIPTDSKSETSMNGINKDSIKAAAAAALAAAALKAQVIAEKEEREIHSLVAKVIELQMKKMELKMKNFEELEQAMERDRLQIERARQALYTEQLAFNQTKLTNTTNPISISPHTTPSITLFTKDPQQL